MNDASKGWADLWSFPPQAFLQTLFAAKPGTAGEPAAVHPLQQQFSELQQTWQASMSRWSALAKDVAAGQPPTADVLREVFDPARWAAGRPGGLDAALQRMLDGPRYATLWDADREMLALQRLRLARDEALAAYQAVVNQGWARAWERFSRGQPEGAAAPPATWRAWTDRWLEVVNDTFVETHRSEAFVQAQARLLRAAADLRLQERKLAEAWCDASHVPTRSEVDELQRHVVALRRQLRTLQRAAPAAEPTPAAPPREKAPAAAKPRARRSPRARESRP